MLFIDLQAKAKEAKKEAKLAKQLQEEELRLLFNEGITNQFGKKKSKGADAAAALGLTEANKAVSEFLEGMSSDSESDSDDDKDGPVYITVDEAPTEVFREKTIEDLIDEQRKTLASLGKVGTPVTSESFAKWRAGKLLQRQAAAEAKLKAEQTKKKGGKGLSVLSGKELFSYNASLFVDDDGAIDAADEKEMALQLKLDALREEARQKEEAERIQEEQRRLAEAQLLEMEVRRQKDEERRKAAASDKRTTFIMNQIVINQVVFEDDEVEDLTPFPEETLVEAIEHIAVDISGDNYVMSSSGAGVEGDDDDDDDNEEEEEEEDGGDDDDSEEEGDDDEGDGEAGEGGAEGGNIDGGKSAKSTS